MTSLRSIALAVTGVIVLAATAAFTLSLGLVLALILSASLAVRMLALRFRPARAQSKAESAERPMRVWNDGRGTIIDL